MGNERSGRRKLAETANGLVLPDMGTTEESIGEYTDAVNRAVEKGQIDPRRAETLQAGARLKLASLRQKHVKSEMAELYAMLAEARAIHQAGLKREAADRRHASDAEVGTSQGGRRNSATT